MSAGRNRYPLTWIAVMIAAIAFFAVLYTQIPQSSPPSPTQATPTGGYFPPPPTTGGILNWTYGPVQELYYDAQYPVTPVNLGAYGPVVKIFETTPSGEPLREAMIYVLGLNASRISPAAFWTAADLAGYAYASPSGSNINYTLYPFPYNATGPEPPYYNDTVRLTLLGAAASPLHYQFPPSANISEPDSTLDQEMQVNEGQVAEEQSGYVVTVYYAGTVTLLVPVAVYNGSDPCLYVSQGGGAYEEVGCGSLMYVKMQVQANTYTGYFGSLTDQGKVKDEITWNGTSITREWVMGSWQLQAVANDTYGSGPCLSNSSQTCTYVYENVGGVFTSSVNQPPAWAFPAGHPPMSEVYRYNYAEGFIQGPGYYYGLAKYLVNETGKLPFESLWLAGSTAEDMNVTNQTYAGAVDPYYSALMAGSGNQTLVAMQVFLVSQYMYPTYTVNGTFNGTAGWAYGYVNVNDAPPTADGMPNYTTNMGYAVMSDPSIRIGGGPLWAWYGCGAPNSNTSLYRPVIVVGGQYTFGEYDIPYPNTPMVYAGQQYNVKVEAANDQLVTTACQS